jgi:cobalt/nickel transport protein
MNPSTPNRNRRIWITGLGTALVIGVCLSPFASQNPDGLDRVAQDLQFEHKATDPIAQQLPFYAVFDEYALRGVPPAIATPLAGLLGTLTTFGVAWGVGKLALRSSAAPPAEPPVAEPPDSEPPDSDRSAERRW